MSIKPPAAAVLIMALSLITAGCRAQAAPVLIGELHPAQAAALKVASPAFAAGGPIPKRDSQYGENAFPGLSWSPAAGARSYVLLVQDADAGGERALVHCLMLDIPGSSLQLPAGAAALPPGARFGRNYTDLQPPWAGPQPPPGRTHHYHFQVFALNAVLPAGAGDSLEALSAAMAGRLIASGEVVGTYQAGF
jgi:Raf kinase inhibitor-like YbhB/YbcL family protein